MQYVTDDSAHTIANRAGLKAWRAMLPMIIGLVCDSARNNATGAHLQSEGQRPPHKEPASRREGMKGRERPTMETAAAGPGLSSHCNVSQGLCTLSGVRACWDFVPLMFSCTLVSPSGDTEGIFS